MLTSEECKRTGRATRLLEGEPDMSGEVNTRDCTLNQHATHAVGVEIAQANNHGSVFLLMS